MTLLSSKYNILDTKEKLELFDATIADKKLISVDTETNGLRLYKTVVIGFSISFNSNDGYYIPMLEWVPDTDKPKKARKVKTIAYESYMTGHFKDIWTGEIYDESITPKEYTPPKFIKQYLFNWTKDRSIIMHNAPFDVNQIYVNFGIDLAPMVFVDTSLLSHIINENSSNALKRIAEEWREDLGINPHVMANQEQVELKTSIINNGGKGAEVWRADPYFLGKYAAADTFLTFGVYEVGMKKLMEGFGEEGLKWFLQDEVMPLCREVVIPMKRKGVYIDVPYFQSMAIETVNKMSKLEDEIVEELNGLLDDFTIAKSFEDAISNQRLVKAIIKHQGLEMPVNLKTGRPSIGKPAVTAAYQKEPHWVWAYILGEDEIQLSKKELFSIKSSLYKDATGNRYRFNIGSDVHLRWLFFDKLKMKDTDIPRTDSGLQSVKADVLEEHMLDKYPWVYKLLVWKKLRKLNSSYISPAMELNIDGYLYMDFRQNGTISGRFSCSGGFNLQTLPRVEDINECVTCGSSNIRILKPINLIADVSCLDCGGVRENIVCPSAIKQGFIAPPGYKIINADFSSLEPRCFAYMSGDDKLKEVYLQNLDLYSKVYCDMEGIDYVDLKKAGMKKERTNIKPVVLGIPYGARGPQVANLMNLKLENERLDVNLGWKKLNQYLDTYGSLRDYMEKQELEAIETGQVRSLIGRRRHFEFTQYVYLILVKAGITVPEFLDMTRNRLSKEFVRPGLNKENLEKFAKKYKMKWDTIEEKGYWALVRALFKGELNNSKNFPIQTLAGHITNKSMLDMARFMRDIHMDGWVCLQVHDEISCYVREADAVAGSKLLRKSMEDNDYAKMIDIPMIADPLIADNLKEAK